MINKSRASSLLPAHDLHRKIKTEAVHQQPNITTIDLKENRSISNIPASKDNPEDHLGKIVRNAFEEDSDWNRHIKKDCLCSKCNCGKHVCKLHPIKLGLKLPQTNYGSNYNSSRNHLKQQLIMKMPTETKLDQIVVNTSNYRNEYSSKKTTIQQPNPMQDNLKTGGPMINLTTYKQNFIPKISPLQQVKVDRSINFPLNTPTSGNSSYRAMFKWRQSQPTQAIINQDQFPKSLHSSFLGKSSYRSDFKAPKLSQYPERVVGTRKYEPIIDLPMQCTVYRREFNAAHLNETMCPAEIERLKHL